MDQVTTQRELDRTKRRLPAAEAARPENARPPPPQIVPLTETDDLEAYLTVFERTAARNQWPRAEWASILAPYLKRPAQRAYHELPEEEAAQYDLLRAELYKRYAITSGQQARFWRHWRFNPELSARAQAFEFWGKLGRWLWPDVNQARQVVEQVACEALVYTMPDYLAQQVQRHSYRDMNGLLEVLERQLAVNQMGASERPARMARQGRIATQEVPHRATTPEPPAKMKDRVLTPPRCFKGGEVGHILPICPLNAEPMDCSYSRGERKGEE
ncbi:uncharacterized protein LOC120530863 [Polypterus senegalus]|uniref:uncharacterized protein LOC120530863 n=1 Tax=Polypterus senegalus TaxID=55291 RepID=UPI001964EA85|nr:uncharacterized protein LOC120530863 [Polypterus senegalus]